MKSIKQTILFNASPHELYVAILDPKKHAQFTNSKATNDMKVGGKFSAYDNYIFGTNLVLEKDKKIVQKWGCTDFPEGHFSEAIFEFIKQPGGTKLVFSQKNVPEENLKSISEGWKEFYWIPLKKMLETK